MNSKRKTKILFLATLIISIFSSIYLQFQIGLDPEISEELAGAYTTTTIFEKPLFTEVEVVKVVLEKIVDIVTISKI